MKHRKLFPTLTSTNQTDCPDFCDQSCPYGCYPYADIYFIPPPPQPPPPPPLSTNQGQPISLYVIIIVSLLASFFLLLSYYVIIVKFCSGRSRFRQPPAQPDDHGEDFLDENRGPGIDHPIWYINTVGLQPSVINSITVFKYKRGDPLIEGSECSVCLSEFKEDETLRLLPKCNHAFHIPCIDTWLRSHTNCPICRAGIFSSTGTVPSASIDPSSLNLNPEEETRMENPETGVELGTNCNWASHSDALENRNEVELLDLDDEIKESDDSEDCVNSDGRGGISVVSCLEEQNMTAGDEIQSDSSSASTISLAESDSNSVNHREDVRQSDLGIVRTQDPANSMMNRVIGSDSITQSLHKSPVSLGRSMSYSGRFNLPRHCRNSSSVLPL